MRAFLTILLSLASIPQAFAEEDPQTSEKETTAFNFQELLAVLPAESLHVALHKHAEDRFQDGIFEHDRAAVEKVHNEDPGMATKVLAEAALHLLKRQQNNDTLIPTTTVQTTTAQAAGGGSTPTTVTRSTTIATTPGTTSTPTSTKTAVIVPVEVSTTNSQGQATTITTSAVASVSESIVQQVTTTNSRGSTVVQSTTVPAAVVTQFNGQVTTSAVSVFVNTPVSVNTKPTDVTTTNYRGATVVLPSVTPGKVVTATDAQGSTFVTTYTPGGGSVSSLVLKTSTLPNGQATTITSFAVVAADTAAGSSASSTSGPRLQNGADDLRTRRFGAEVVAIVGGALGAALLL